MNEELPSSEYTDFAGSEVVRLIEDFLPPISGAAAAEIVSGVSWFTLEFPNMIAPIMADVHEATSHGAHDAAATSARSLDSGSLVLETASLRISQELQWPYRHRILLLNTERPVHPAALFAARAALFHVPLAQTLQGFAICMMELSLGREEFTPQSKSLILAKSQAALLRPIGLTDGGSRFHIEQTDESCAADRDRIPER